MASDMPDTSLGLALWCSRGDTRRAMSQGRVEAMRAAMAAFNRRDGEAFGAVFAEVFEFVPVPAAVERTVYRGPDAGAQYCAAVDEIWGTSDGRSRSSAKAATGCLPWDTYEGRDATAGSTSTHGRAGWPASAKAGNELHTYADRADALDAMGLSE